MRTRSSLAAALALAALVLLSPPARAHDAASPLALAVEVERARVAVVARYTIERGEAARALREQFDRDADGALDAGERQALTDYLAGRALAAFSVQLGDATLGFVTRSVDVDLEGDARVAVVVRALAKVTWPPSASTTLRVAVTLEARAITPVALRIGNAAAAELALPEGFAGGEAARGSPLSVPIRRTPRLPAHPRPPRR